MPRALHWLSPTLLLCALPALAAPAPPRCPPPGYDAAQLQALKAAEFRLPDAGRRNRLALALLECLGDPDPVLRDGVAYEALATWMRQQQLSPATLQALYDALLPMLSADDPRGVRRPFAALVLSELARTDRIAPWLGATQRARLVDAAATYLSGVRDYRGFTDGEGWRHGVAHAADVALQLAANPALKREQLDTLRAAIAAQIAPSHPYIHGEPQRLARPILLIAQRGLHDANDWQAWLTAVAAPAPLPNWDAAFTSEAGLAKRHDTLAFLTALYVLAQESDDATTRDRLLPGLRAVLKTVP